MAGSLDPYATLGIPAHASRAEAARAHRRLAKQFHPDVNHGREAAERMRRLNAAWRIVSDPARRARYDAERGGPTTAASSAHWSGRRSSYRYDSRTASAAWTTWPDERHAAAARVRRPTRGAPVEPSFGDRPSVVVAVWLLLGLLYFVATWLGSTTP